MAPESKAESGSSYSPRELVQNYLHGKDLPVGDALPLNRLLDLLGFEKDFTGNEVFERAYALALSDEPPENITQILYTAVSYFD